MRSRAEPVARAASFALIAFALWRLLSGAGAGGAARVGSAELRSALPAIESGSAAALHVDLDSTPTPADRDALAAVARAGTRVTWSGAGIAPLAAVAVRAREPGAHVQVNVASATDVAFSDGLAALDTVRAASATKGATIGVGAPSGALGARSRGTGAPVGVPAAAALRPVLIVGRAGWEAKFAAAALEEQGWIVEERLFVAPGADVTQGGGAIDTSRYSAIVVLDTTLGAAGGSIVRFVREGGGLVLLGASANASQLRGIAPARAGARRLPASSALDVAEPLGGLAVFPLESPRTDAVRLSVRGPLIVAAARREGAGRVLQAGYDETWRWRMQGGADALAAHRAWWSRMVGSVAATPLVIQTGNPSAEGAPLARLVDALGPATKGEAGPRDRERLPAWLLPAILLSLLFEWGARRGRGAQ
jgi:hypothetical protein